MKNRRIRSWIITLALAAGLAPFSPMLFAQSQGQNPDNQKQQSPMAQQHAQKKAHTFMGKIVKTRTGKYALLTDAKRGQGYFLDDQADAKKFDQKNVKIVATLDPQTNTLHVLQITLAS